jgi:aldose 1-epimerase
LTFPQGAYIERFGTMPDGSEVQIVTLSQQDRMSVSIISLGASVQAIRVKDRRGQFADVVLGHASPRPYLDTPQYLGSTVGRVANRLCRGRFDLDGVSYQIPPNNGPNALHGGPLGFDRRNWRLIDMQGGTCPSVLFGLISPHNDQGFPGELEVTALYTLDKDCRLGVQYHARTDRPTIVNLTNHTYWNLTGEAALSGQGDGAMGHILQIEADTFLPIDEHAIPTGQLRPVDQTPFDFRLPRTISSGLRSVDDDQIIAGRGYDHNWVLNDTGRQGIERCATRPVSVLSDPLSGRVMKLSTNQPGIQFYSGNYLDGQVVGKAGLAYQRRDAICLEPQAFPDTPNHPHFGSIVLRPGETYFNEIIWQFSVDTD